MVLGKPGCHMCEAVEAELHSMEGVAPRLKTVDISKDRVLHERYLLRIPVVIMGDEVIFEGSMMDLKGDWKLKLRSALNGP